MVHFRVYLWGISMGDDVGDGNELAGRSIAIENLLWFSNGSLDLLDNVANGGGGRLDGLLDLGGSNGWAGSNDLRSSLISVLLEVVVEEDTKLGHLLLKVGRTSPGSLGVKKLRRHARARGWDVKVEGVVDFIFGLGEITRVDGIEDGTSVLEGAALAASGCASTNPAGVEEPGVGRVLADLVSEHTSVAHWVEGKEWLCEAGGEGGLGLGDTILSTSHLGGVTGDEVEHGLLRGELGDWWEDATGITGEKDDVLGVAVGDTWDLGVLNVLDWVGTACVLGESGVIVVDGTSFWVEDNVLENGAEADGIENIWFLLCRKANALGIATTLNVEDTSVGPAVLVITDEGTLRVGGKSSLSGTGETEEDGDITILTLVSRRVKGEDVVLDRHLVEEHGEDTLLHLTGVLGSEDNHLLLGKVDGDGSGTGHTLSPSVGWERTGVVDDIVGVEVLELGPRWSDEHVAHEEGMVGTSANNTNVDAVAGVPAGETVDDVDAVAGVEVVNGTLAVNSPYLSIQALRSALLVAKMKLSAKISARASFAKIAGSRSPMSAGRMISSARRVGGKGGEGGIWRRRTSGLMALLTGPHQTSLEELSSLTIRLSRGERPVLAPE